MYSEPLAKKAIAAANRTAARAVALADRGVVLAVTWAEPDAAEVLRLIDLALKDWSQRSLIDSNSAVNLLLDLRSAVLGTNGAQDV